MRCRLVVVVVVAAVVVVAPFPSIEALDPARVIRSERDRWPGGFPPRRRSSGGAVRTSQWYGKSWRITVADTEVRVVRATGTITVPSTGASCLEVRP